jgi:uncharacterized protein YggE
MLKPLVPLSLALALAAMPALADDAERTRTLSVTGIGEVMAEPDMAHVSLGVTTEGNTAAQALDLNTAAMTRVFAALTKAGIAEKDVQTTTVSLSPLWSRPVENQRPKIRGYQASNQVVVTARDFAALGSLLDTVSEAGATDIGGISFDVSGRDALEDEARRLAGADARRKAEIYAASLGATLGPVLSISEMGGPRPYPKVMMRAEMAMADAPVPIAGGEQSISTSLSVVFELQ